MDDVCREHQRPWTAPRGPSFASALGSPTLAAVATAALLGGLLFGCDGRLNDEAPTGAEVRSRTTVASDVERGGARLIYVPAYAYAAAPGGNKIRLATTLTIHNIGSESRVRVHSLEYYSSPGKFVENYLEHPRELGPLETLEVVVEASEMTEGTGANFVVSWEGPAGTPAPLVEALMVGKMGAGWVTFTSRGVEVDM